MLFEGHPAEWLFDADEDGRWVATDYDYFGGPEASKGWAPEYIDRLSIDDDDQSWKFARAWTLGEVVTALLRTGLRLQAVTEYPVDWWGGHDDVRPEDRGRIPLVVLDHREPSARSSRPQPEDGRRCRDGGAIDRAVDVRVGPSRVVIPPGTRHRIQVDRQREEVARIVGVVPVRRRDELVPRRRCSG